MTDAVDAPGAAAAKPRGLWFHAEFRKLWIAQIISAFGSRVTREAIPTAAVLLLAATPGEISWLVAAGMLPAAILALFVGVWVDRLKRRPILIAADLGRAAVLCVAPLAWWMDFLNLWVLGAVALASAFLTLLFQLADNAYLPSIIGRDRLMEGNSKLGASESVAETGGPALAGFLIQILGAPLAILVDALSYVASALFLGAIRTPEKDPPKPTQAPHLWREMREGLGLVVGHPVLRALIGATATATFFGGFFMTLYTYFGLSVLGLSPWWLGVVISMGGVGAFVGSVIAPWFARRVAVGALLFWSRLVGGAAQFLIPLAALPIAMGGPWEIAAALLIGAQLIGDAGLVVFMITEATLRQSSVPDRILGRTEATVRMATGVLMIAGAFAGGWIAEAFGATSAFVVAAAGQLVTAFWLLAPAVRRVKAMPSELEQMEPEQD